MYDDVVADEGLPVDIWNVDYAEASAPGFRVQGLGCIFPQTLSPKP